MAKKKEGIVVEQAKLASINQMLFTAAAGLIVILGTRMIAADLLAPLLVVFFLTALLRPLFGYFRGKGLSAGLSVLAMVVTVFVGGGFVMFLMWQSIDILRQSLSTYTAAFDQVVETVGAPEEVVRSFSPESVMSLFMSLIGNLHYLILYFIIIPVLSVLLLLQLDSMPKEMLSGLAKGSTTVEKMGRFSSSMVKYVGGRLKVNAITGAAFTTVLLLLGIDFAFLWGFMTIILGFVPYIGFVLTGLFPTLIAYAQYGPVSALLVVASLLIIDFIAENFLDPKIQGARNRISTASLVLALIFWTWLLGPLGAILSAPLTFLMKIIMADYQETAWIAQFMEGNYKESKKQMKSSNLGMKLKSFVPFKKK